MTFSENSIVTSKQLDILEKNMQGVKSENISLKYKSVARWVCNGCAMDGCAVDG